MHEQHGGFSAVARAVSEETGDTCTRQQIFTWWLRRRRNGFPDRVRVGDRDLFDIDDVIAWRRSYVPSRGGRPRRREAPDGQAAQDGRQVLLQGIPRDAVRAQPAAGSVD